MPQVPDTTVAYIEVTPAARTIGMLGGTARFAAGAYSADGTLLLTGADLSWSSSDPQALSVGPNQATGLRNGTPTMTVSADGAAVDVPILVQDAARVAWTAPLDWTPGTAGPPGDLAIGNEGEVFLGVNTASSSRWFAFSAQGAPLWWADLPRTWFSTAAIGTDGTLYVGSTPADGGGSLIAVGTGGAVRWSRPLSRILSAPAVADDGRVFAAGGRSVYALSPDGELVWVYDTGGGQISYSSPSLGQDGTIYVGDGAGRLHAIDADGSPQWTFRAGGAIQSSPAVGPSGTIYFGANDGRLYAVSPAGSEEWSVRTNCGGPLGCTPLQASPSIGADGTVYIGGDNVVAVTAAGAVRWSYRLPMYGNVLSTPVVGGDRVYVAFGSAVFALDTEGRLVWDYRPGGTTFGSPAIGIDGSVLAAFAEASEGSWSGMLHAIAENGTQSGGYEGAAWPTARGPRSNTGRAGG